MCGLFGWSLKKGKVSSEQKAVLATALSIHMDRRGGNSWGYYAPEEDTLVKGLGNISACIPATDLHYNDVMAHTRYATTGKITTDNAHPFQLETVVGAHNGIVSNHTALNSIHKRSCSVDSMHLFHHIQDGLDMDDINGYGAIEYVQKKTPERIFLGYFNGGELHIADMKGQGLIWASTRAALETAAQMAGVKEKGLTFYTVKESILYYAERGQLWGTNKRIDVSPYYSSPLGKGWKTQAEEELDVDEQMALELQEMEDELDRRLDLDNYER